MCALYDGCSFLSSFAGTHGSRSPDPDGCWFNLVLEIFLLSYTGTASSGFVCEPRVYCHLFVVSFCLGIMSLYFIFAFSVQKYGTVVLWLKSQTKTRLVSSTSWASYCHNYKCLRFQAGMVPTESITSFFGIGMVYVVEM